jgi:hypothetical protein
MKMTMEEARIECQRYLDYLAREEEKSLALQRLAADRRMGRCGDKEKDRRIAEIMGVSPVVYDGGNLADAIRIMLKATAPDVGRAGK